MFIIRRLLMVARAYPSRSVYSRMAGRVASFL
jgi:hypothetical protein